MTMFDQPYSNYSTTTATSWNGTHLDELPTALPSSSSSTWSAYSATATATGYDQASWQYPTPNSDCTPLAPATTAASHQRQHSWGPPAFADNPLHEQFSTSLHHPYPATVHPSTYSPAPFLETSVAQAIEQPVSADEASLLPSRNPSPTPPQLVSYSQSQQLHPSTIYHSNTSRPSYHYPGAGAISPPSWGYSSLNSSSLAPSAGTAEWTHQPLHATTSSMTTTPLPLAPSTASDFSTSAVGNNLDRQDRGTWSEPQPAPTQLASSYSWAQQGEPWQAQPLYTTSGQQDRPEVRPPGSVYWEWPAPSPLPLPPSVQSSQTAMSRAGSLSGSQSAATVERDSSVSTSTMPATISSAIWDQDTSASWLNASRLHQSQLPRSRIGTPIPIDHTSSSATPAFSHLSRGQVLNGGSVSSLAELAKRTLSPAIVDSTPITLTTIDKGKGKEAAVSVAPSPPSTGSNSVAGDPPAKQRKQRRKANEPPRDAAQRRYACELCVEEPRLFARPSALKIHLLTHTKEKPHTCPTCQRAFAIASNLKRHQKLHAASAKKAEEARMANGHGEEEFNDLG